MTLRSYDQIIVIEIHNLSSYFSLNLLDFIDRTITPTPLNNENLSYLIDYSDDEISSLDLSAIGINKNFIKDLERIQDYKFKNPLVGDPSIFLPLEEIINVTEACWGYIYDKSAANLRVKIDYTIVKNNTFVFTEYFTNWFLNLILN